MASPTAKSGVYTGLLPGRPLPGLICAFRFYPDGTAVELNVEQPIVGGWRLALAAFQLR